MKKGHFQGWYFKHQIGERVFSFIISFHKDKTGSESAFIQFITNECALSVQYPLEECMVDTQKFQIQMGHNRFSEDGCRVKLKNDEMEVNCNIKYKHLHPLESSIMGPFAKVPGLQCRHEIRSMKHEIHGFLELNGEAIELTGGVGYIEGDEGHSFPKSYMWTQCNFKYKDYHSIVLAAANIPMPVKSFEGVICQILYRGRSYRLATYLGARIIQKNSHSITIKQGKMRVYVMALDKGGHALKSPINGEMMGRIYENPTCRVRYIFYKEDKKIFDFISRVGSFESVTKSSIHSVIEE